MSKVKSSHFPCSNVEFRGKLEMLLTEEKNTIEHAEKLNIHFGALTQ